MSSFRARITSNAADPFVASRMDKRFFRNIFETACRNRSSSSTTKIVAPRAASVSSWRAGSRCGLPQSYVPHKAAISLSRCSRNCRCSFLKVPQSSTTSSFQVVESKDALKGSAPAPKADSGRDTKSCVFSTFCFKQMARPCCVLLKSVELLESYVYDFIYTPQATEVVCFRHKILLLCRTRLGMDERRASFGGVG